MKKTKCRKAKGLSEEVLQTAEKRTEAKGKGGKERYTHLNAEFQRIARGDKIVLFLPGESHGRRSLIGYSPWGRKESDTTEPT